MWTSTKRTERHLQLALREQVENNNGSTRVGVRMTQQNAFVGMAFFTAEAELHDASLIQAVKKWRVKGVKE